MLASLTIRSRHDHHPPIQAPIPRKHLASRRTGYRTVMSDPTVMRIDREILYWLKN
jgi:hypothetical protein